MKQNLKRTYIKKTLKRGLLMLMLTGIVTVMIPTLGNEKTANAASTQSASDTSKKTLREQDPEYYKYYDEDGNRIDETDSSKEDTLNNSGADSSANAAANSALAESSSNAAANSVLVTDKKITSPFTQLHYNSDSTVFTGKNGNVAHGVDVSYYQGGSINWKKVKAAGVDYAIIRCGYRGLSDGKLYNDVYFQRNLEGALAAGLKVGIYVFSQATTVKEAIEEADFCISRAGDYLYSLEMPIVTDVEYGYSSCMGRLYYAKLTKSELTKVVKAFSDEVAAKGGIPAYYCNRNFLEYKLNPTTLKKAGCSLWYARFYKNANTSTFTNTDWFMWQYDEAYVTGIGTGTTDVNFVYEDCIPYEEPEDEDCTYENVTTTSTSDTDTGSSSAATVTTDHRVTNVEVTAGTQKIKLSWTPQNKGYGYVIRRSTNGKTWTRMAVIRDVTVSSWKDATVQEGKTYQYQISTRLTADGSERSNYTASVYAILKLAAPTAGNCVTAQSTGIKLVWKKVSYATGYRVYRKTADSSYARLTETTKNAFLDKTADYGVAYTYTVRAYVDMPDGSRIYGSYMTATELTKTPAAPTVTEVEYESTNALHIVWTPTTDAKGYRIYKKEAGGKYAYLTSVKAGDANTYPDYTDTNAGMGVTYEYCVRAIVLNTANEKVFSAYSAGKSGYTIPPVVTLKKLTASGFNGLTLSWKSINGVNGYQIQKVNANGTRTTVTYVNQKTTAFRISGLTNGQTYTYTVRAYLLKNGKKVFGELEAEGISAAPVLPTATFTLSSSASGKVKVTWKKVNDADGYCIFYKSGLNQKGSKIAQVTGNKTFSANVSGTKGKYRYYTVRAYRVVNGKRVYSNYTWQKIKVKA